ncbi:hypothetical protein JCM10213_003715 [Rhodosporidiobolus nylandii]
MASQKLHDCLICPKRTSLRCAGSSAEDKDSAVFFCSREHQRLGWPAHRVFCKNGGAFTFPPLTKEEADTLARLQRNPKSPVAPVLSQLAGMGLWGGNWATLEMEMQSSSSSVSEPERTAILIVLRKRLVNHFEQFLDRSIPPPSGQHSHSTPSPSSSRPTLPSAPGRSATRIASSRQDPRAQDHVAANSVLCGLHLGKEVRIAHNSCCVAHFAVLEDKQVSNGTARKRRRETRTNRHVSFNLVMQRTIVPS